RLFSLLWYQLLRVNSKPEGINLNIKRDPAETTFKNKCDASKKHKAKLKVIKVNLRDEVNTSRKAGVVLPETVALQWSTTSFIKEHYQPISHTESDSRSCSVVSYDPANMSYCSECCESGRCKIKRFGK
ncbi:hypothetical protein L9F63_007856, partial [Diploptera punctata]